MSSMAAVIIMGVFTLIMVGVMVFMVIKNYGSGDMREFDERQKLAQGQAAKAALFTIIIYIFAVGLFDVFNEVMWAPFIIEGFIGIALGLSVYASVCIFKDAYVAVRVKPARMLLFIGGICITNMGICLPFFFKGSKGFVTDGLLNIHSMNLICAIMLFIIFWELVAKIYLNRIEEARGE